MIQICLFHVFFFFFFFQAEDGIRDLTVTGVQTCALPISSSSGSSDPITSSTTPTTDAESTTSTSALTDDGASTSNLETTASPLIWARSEERRVGKECRSRWSAYH